MTTPNQKDVEAFMSITGVGDQASTRRLLEEHGGNLDAAVNAHFSEAERYNIIPRQGDNPVQDRPRGILPLLSAVRSFKPSSLLDPNYRRHVMNQIGASAFGSPPPSPFAHAGNSNSGNMLPHLSRPAMPFMNVTGTSLSHGQDHSDVPRDDGHHADDNDIEENMIKAAIEASRQEGSSSGGHSGRQLDEEDDELSRAISESLKIMEQEKAGPDQTADNHEQEPGVNSSIGRSDESYDAVAEWGGISSSELDEAMMLEAALFGQIPEATSNQIQNVPTPQSTSDRNTDPDSEPVPNHPSPFITEQWLPRAQQKDVEKLLAAKETSLPQEPALHDENAITLLVRMPDASRHGRRFLKSDKLKFLFDFIDFTEAVKPGSYRLVRPYPRLVFTAEEGSSSLNELGLTNRQEALFLEFI